MNVTMDHTFNNDTNYLTSSVTVGGFTICKDDIMFRVEPSYMNASISQNNETTNYKRFFMEYQMDPLHNTFNINISLNMKTNGLEFGIDNFRTHGRYYETFWGCDHFGEPVEMLHCSSNNSHYFVISRNNFTNVNQSTYDNCVYL